MMSISMHDRISGIPGRVKLIEEFIKYAQKQKGVVFMRKRRDRQVGFVSAAQHTSRELRMV
jgi:galactokinase